MSTSPIEPAAEPRDNSFSKQRASAVIALLVIAIAGVYLYLHHARFAANYSKTPDIISQLPPQAPVVAYIDVAALRKLQNSPLVDALGLAPSTTDSADRDYQNFVRATGFDYTRDLDAVAIADWPSGLQAGTTPALSNETVANRLIAIANGRFDESKIKTYALQTGKAVQRGKLTVYEVPGDAPGDPPISFEFLSPNQIALASGASVEDLPSLPSSTARDPSMQSLIERVAGAPLFAVARTNSLPAAFYENFAGSPQLQQLARSVTDISLAVSPASSSTGLPNGSPDALPNALPNGSPDNHQEVQLALDAECDSLKDALEMSTDLEGFRMFGSLALADPKTRRKMTPGQIQLLLTVLHQVKITRADRSVRLTLEVTPAMIQLATAPPPPPSHAH
jgi:hypothetical protein